MYNFFFLDGAVETPCYPIYDDNFRIKHEAVDGEAFKHMRCDGVFRFMRGDYTYIIGKALEDRILVNIRDAEGLVLQVRFTRRMGETNFDDRVFTVSPEVVDGYEDFLKLMDIEVNWLDGAPAHESFHIFVPPMVQIYEAGSENITCYSHAGWWTQKVRNVISDFPRLTGLDAQGCKFGAPTQITYAVTSFPFDTLIFTNSSNGMFRFRSIRETNIDFDPQDRMRAPEHLFRWVVERIIDGAIYWDSVPERQRPPIERVEFEPVHINAGGRSLSFRRRTFFCRVVSNAMPTGARLLPEEDVLPGGFYRSAIPITGAGITATDGFTETHTPGLSTTLPIPIDPSDFDIVSIWYGSNTTVEGMLANTAFVEEFTLRHVYSLPAIMNRLLQGVGANIQFDITDCGILQPGTLNKKYGLTPKSNVTTFNYTNAATVSTLTLGQFLDMLKKVFKVYWHIEGGRLKLNHITFYLSGGSDWLRQNTFPTFHSMIDFSAFMARKSNLPLDFGLRKVTYDNEVLPAEIQHEWMDNSSQAFKGYGINYNINAGSQFFANSVIEKIEFVSTDILYTLVNPDAASREGLFLLAADLTNNIRPFSFTIVRDGGINAPRMQFRLLNGEVSFAYMLEAWHRFDLLSRTGHVQRFPRFAEPTMKPVVNQTFNFPYQIRINPLQGMRTALGFGVVHEISVNLTNHYATGLLKMGLPPVLPPEG